MADELLWPLRQRRFMSDFATFPMVPCEVLTQDEFVRRRDAHVPDKRRFFVRHVVDAITRAMLYIKFDPNVRVGTDEFEVMTKKARRAAAAAQRSLTENARDLGGVRVSAVKHENSVHIEVGSFIRDRLFPENGVYRVISIHTEGPLVQLITRRFTGGVGDECALRELNHGINIEAAFYLSQAQFELCVVVTPEEYYKRRADGDDSETLFFLQLPEEIERARVAAAKRKQGAKTAVRRASPHRAEVELPARAEAAAPQPSQAMIDDLKAQLSDARAQVHQQSLRCTSAEAKLHTMTLDMARSRSALEQAQAEHDPVVVEVRSLKDQLAAKTQRLDAVSGEVIRLRARIALLEANDLKSRPTDSRGKLAEGALTVQRSASLLEQTQSKLQWSIAESARHRDDAAKMRAEREPFEAELRSVKEQLAATVRRAAGAAALRKRVAELKSQLSSRDERLIVVKHEVVESREQVDAAMSQVDAATSDLQRVESLKRKAEADLESRAEHHARRLEGHRAEQARLAAELEQAARQCALCLDAPPAVVYAPCGHLTCCESCDAGLPKRECPICQKKITSKRKVFFA